VLYEPDQDLLLAVLGSGASGFLNDGKRLLWPGAGGCRLGPWTGSGLAPRAPHHPRWPAAPPRDRAPSLLP